MTKEEHIKFWLDSAEDDLESSFVIFNSKRYHWSLFIAHLALEKILKALYVQFSDNKTPPRIHNLLKLAELSNIMLNEEKQDFFTDVNRFHIEARYPEFKDELRKIATEEFTTKYLNIIKEQFIWLKSMIKL
jgi:HEPN domain-containing protein